MTDKPRNPIDLGDSQNRVNRIIGRNIKDLRRTAKKTRAILAKDLGVTDDYLKQVEDGEIRLTSVHLHRLSKLLKVEMEDFFPEPNFSNIMGFDELVFRDSLSDSERLLKAFSTIKSKKQRSALIAMVEMSAGMPADSED